MPAREAAVPARDRGLLLGDGLFETVRIYGGRMPLLARHLERLARGAAVLGIPVPPGIPGAAAATVEACGVRDGSLRITLTRGPGPRGYDPPADPEPLLLIQAEPFARPEPGPGPGSPSAPGPLAAALVASIRRDPRSPLTGLKTTSALASVLARTEARAAGAAEAVLLSTDGHVAEGAATNVFWVRDGVLHTPSTAAGCLPGIARAVVLELARALGIPVAEGLFPPGSLAQATEVFLTSALLEVAPCRSIAGMSAVSGAAPETLAWPAPGPVTARLAAAYREFTRAEAGGA